MTQSKKNASKSGDDIFGENKSQDPETRADQIEGELDQTRGALKQDIAELSDKLSPQHLKHEAKNALIDAKDSAVDKLVETKDKAVDKLVETKDKAVDKLVETKEVAAEKLGEAKEFATEKLHEYEEAAGEALETASEQLRRTGDAALTFARGNALPLALLGIGATWLIANGRRGRRDRVAERGNVPYRDLPERPELLADTSAYPGAETSSGYAGDGARRGNGGRSNRRPTARGGQRAESSRHAASSVHDKVDSARHAVGRAGHEVGELASRARHKAAEAYDNTGQAVRERLAEGRAFARDQFDRLREGSRELMQSNPLAFGVLALATGVGIGLLLPQTAGENKWYGPTRDRFVGEARGVAADARETAQELRDVARDTASSLI